MNRRLMLWSGLGGVGLAAAGGGAWVLSLPAETPTTAPPPIAKGEADATLTALRPPKRQRPLVAIVGINDATEVMQLEYPRLSASL